MINSIDSLLTALPQHIEPVAMSDTVTLYFRGLRDAEAKRLDNLGGKMILHPDGSQEYDLSGLKLGGDVALFAMGWVNEEGNNIIPYKNRKQWEHAVSQLAQLGAVYVQKGAAKVRELTEPPNKDDFLAMSDE